MGPTVQNDFAETKLDASPLSQSATPARRNGPSGVRLSSSEPSRKSRPKKLDTLTPVQTQALLEWLNEENAIYTVVQGRLAKEFGIRVSIPCICRFWQRQTIPPTSTQATPDALLDVIIQSATPVRLIVKSKSGGVTLTQVANPPK